MNKIIEFKFGCCTLVFPESIRTYDNQDCEFKTLKTIKYACDRTLKPTEYAVKFTS